MKLKLFVLNMLVMILWLTTLWAQPPNFSRAGWSQNQSAPPAFLTLSHYPALRLVDSLTTTTAKRERAVGKALFFSAVVPGAGQFYNKSFLKGLAFAGIEIGAWAVNAIYTQRGDKKRRSLSSMRASIGRKTDTGSRWRSTASVGAIIDGSAHKIANANSAIFFRTPAIKLITKTSASTINSMPDGMTAKAVSPSKGTPSAASCIRECAKRRMTNFARRRMAFPLFWPIMC